MQFLTSIKGHNSKVIWRNLPIYNPKPLLAGINSYAKFEENRSKSTQVRERKWTKCNLKPQSGAITLRLFDEIYPSTIPNHSLPVSTRIQSLKKIGQKLLKLESRNKWRHLDFQTVNWPLWPWKLGQGHWNLITPFGCPNEVSVPVWSKSIQWFRRYCADKKLRRRRRRRQDPHQKQYVPQLLRRGT